MSGLDILKWYNTWSDNGRYLAAARMCVSVIEAALAFGASARHPGCAELLEISRITRKQLPRPKKRTAVLTAEQVIAARQAAHEQGRPSRALAYAIAYETTLRLWDVIGQWYPLEKGGVSDVIDPRSMEKWFGLRWENIDEHLVLRVTPSKTDATTSASMAYPLSKAPMVLQELQHWPLEKRSGPIIISGENGAALSSAPL